MRDETALQTRDSFSERDSQRLPTRRTHTRETETGCAHRLYMSVQRLQQAVMYVSHSLRLL